jgi:hypothetical protein
MYAYEWTHMTFLEPHRPSDASYHALKRMGFWQTMYVDFTKWIYDCAVCHQFRTSTTIPPMRTIFSGAKAMARLPWSDVIIDCQGPFTVSAKGNQYLVSYHCTLLGVPKIEAFASMEKSKFLKAMLPCMWRARRCPDIIRTDRGAEFTSVIMQEFFTLCNSKQFLGAGFTPRHQGPGERKHQEVMSQWLILIHKICKAFPQEWDELAPVIEYLLDTEIGELGFSAHELQSGYALLQQPDATLAPFVQPKGLPQTDICVKLFSTFRELAGKLARHKEEKNKKQREQVNQHRHVRTLQLGETVFRKMPAKARAPKHLLGEPSKGTYIVMGQSSVSSVKLKDPATGQMLEGGLDIPLDQILLGPKRSTLKFDEDDTERSVGMMLLGSDQAGQLPPGIQPTGWKPGQKKGWKGLSAGTHVAYRSSNSKELSVAKVLHNNREHSSIEVHTCKAIWSGISSSLTTVSHNSCGRWLDRNDTHTRNC